MELWNNGNDCRRADGGVGGAKAREDPMREINRANRKDMRAIMLVLVGRLVHCYVEFSINLENERDGRHFGCENE